MGKAVILGTVMVLLFMFAARLRVEEAYLGHDFSDDTTLDFLLPTSEGAGACTSALVDFLVLQHNNFIERCRAVMKEREMR